MSSPSRIAISIPVATPGGLFRGRYPLGNVPLLQLGSAAANDIASASGALTTASGGGGGTVPSAVLGVTAYAIPGGVTVRFKRPASVGSSAITSYTATASVGGSPVTQSAVPIITGSANYSQLNRRIDMLFGFTAGTPVTVTVHATNLAGDGPASAASNSVTPTALPSPLIAVPGNQSAGWGDFSYGTGGSGGLFAYYGVTPGSASLNGTTSNPSGAPTNPVLSTRNVVEVDFGNGFQPNIQYINPANTLGGRLPMAQYTNLILSLWPTAASGENIGFLKTLWIDGDASISNAGGNTVLTDNTQNWPVNAFSGADILNITQNTNGFNVVSNTATTITMGSGCTFAAGDLYSIAIPDIQIGQRINVGGGSNPPGVIGPTTFVLNAWNTITAPLTVFNAGSGNYPNVSLANILKFSSQPSGSVPATNVRYFCNVGFS